MRFVVTFAEFQELVQLNATSLSRDHEKSSDESIEIDTKHIQIHLHLLC